MAKPPSRNELPARLRADERPRNLQRESTACGYAAGAADIPLEDQEFLKKRGHAAYHRVITADEPAAKMRVADRHGFKDRRG